MQRSYWPEPPQANRNNPALDSCVMRTPFRVLVTGGAGYIGSHVALALRDRGDQVVVLDDLSTGFREAVLDAPLVVGDVGDEALVGQLLREHGIDAVMHFAARTSLPESLRQPERYYENNYSATARLLRACRAAGTRHFVFSSTAAVYGPPADGHASEAMPAAPATPYGRSKLMVEWLLEDLARATPLRYVALRYFNVAGCDPQGRIGHDTVGASQLVKVVCEHAAGKRGHVDIYGTHWPTPDGTGVRDYIHVGDLAAAHLCALDHLAAGGVPATLNVGYGRGYSVREVIAEATRLAGRPLDVREQPPRPGDLGMVVARNERILATLPWRPTLDSLEAMVGSTLAWEQRGPRREARR